MRGTNKHILPSSSAGDTAAVAMVSDVVTGLFSLTCAQTTRIRTPDDDDGSLLLLTAVPVICKLTYAAASVQYHSHTPVRYNWRSARKLQAICAVA